MVYFYDRAPRRRQAGGQRHASDACSRAFNKVASPSSRNSAFAQVFGRGPRQITPLRAIGARGTGRILRPADATPPVTGRTLSPKVLPADVLFAVTPTSRLRTIRPTTRSLGLL